MKVEKFGQGFLFPPTANQTKNAMRSYIIRLSAFEGVDLSAVTGVTLDFSPGFGSATYAFDDFEFYH